MGIARGLLQQTGQRALRRTSWRVLGVLPRAWAVVEMRQEALDHRRVFDAGNDLHNPATGFAGLDIEYALQTLRLRLIAARLSTGGSSAVTA